MCKSVGSKNNNKIFDANKGNTDTPYFLHVFHTPNIPHSNELPVKVVWLCVMLFLLSRVYIWTRMVHAEARQGRMYGTFLQCSAFAKASNRPYINVLNANSLWSTDIRWTEIGCLPNVRHTAEYYLPRNVNIF